MTDEVATLRQKIVAMQQTQAGLDSYIAALTSQLDQVRRALHIAKLGIWEWDLASDTIWCSPEWIAQLGHAGDSRCSREFFLLNVHSEDRDMVDQGLARAAREPAERLDREFRWKAASGEFVWVLVRFEGVEDRPGRTQRVAGVLIDVTERKAAEVALAAAAERTAIEGARIRVILDVMPVGLVITNPSGCVTESNAIARRLCGTEDLAAGIEDFSEYRGWNSKGERIAPPDWPAARSLLNAETVLGEEISLHAFDDELRTLLVSAAPILGTDGKVAGAVVAMVDVSAHKRAEAEKARISVQAQESKRMESLGVLAGGIAHDFNNRLAEVLGNASLIARSNPSPQIAEYAQTIEESAQRAADLCQQMLTYAGTALIRSSPIDLNRLTETALAAPRPVRGPRTRVRFLPGSPPSITGDAALLGRALGNLLANAYEELGANAGHVNVSTGFEEGRAFIEVADSGTGMDAGTLSRVFDPFFSTKFPGRGLGLAAAFGVAKQHGGSIDAKSAPGEGSAFRLWLPIGGSGPRTL